MINHISRLLGSVNYRLRQLVKKRQVLVTARKLESLGIKPVFVDIGSNGGLPNLLTYLADKHLISVIMVDVQDDWLKMGTKSDHKDIIRIKAGLGSKIENRKLFITRGLGCSSCLMPNLDVLQDFPVVNWFEVIKEEEIKLTTYENIHKDHRLPRPNIVKIDVQGLEMSVLNGFGDLTPDVICVATEVQLEKIYKDQLVFSEVYSLMKHKGFVLRDLKPQGPFEGQAIEFNAYWSRDLRSLSASQKLIHELWQEINSVWPGDYFETQNRAALINGSILESCV
jgi:FkbM family methyltransferase